MKMKRQFLTTCASEALFSNKQVSQGGLGLQFGFPGNSITWQDTSKMKLWKNYFDGN